MKPLQPDSTHTRARKRLFIGLISATSLVVIVICGLLWIIPYIGLQSIHPAAPLFFAVLFGAAILFTLWAWLSLLANIHLGRPVLFSKRMRGLTIKIFLPLMTLLGRLAGISKEDIRHSFIKVNNELVRAENRRYPGEKILLLMPHCLQSSRCDMRLTYDIDNCRRCGKCPIKILLDIRDKHGVHVAIATGGTIARRIVVQTRPKLIIAVACERDLASGIQDTYPIPVYGILNERPHGPCLDTLVQRSSLEEALALFLESPSHDSGVNSVDDFSREQQTASAN